VTPSGRREAWPSPEMSVNRVDAAARRDRDVRDQRVTSSIHRHALAGALDDKIAFPNRDSSVDAGGHATGEVLADTPAERQRASRCRASTGQSAATGSREPSDPSRRMNRRRRLHGQNRDRRDDLQRGDRLAPESVSWVGYDAEPQVSDDSCDVILTPTDPAATELAVAITRWKLDPLLRLRDVEVRHLIFSSTTSRPR